MIGTKENYKIMEVFYKSQYITVFKALNVKTNEKVMIKELNTEFNNPINISKFKNRYNLIKSLDSEYVVKVYEFLEFENRFSVVLEDCGGTPLSYYINNNYIQLKELLQIALKITRCIKYIHSNHIIHKNINPLNIIYNSDKKIIKLFGFENSSEFSFETAEALNPNVFYEKLCYISPEQTGRMNRPIDYRTDFYSLGITLYELACSKLPFASFDPADIVYFHMAKTPLAIDEINQNIPPVVSQIISKLMGKMVLYLLM